MFGFFGSDPFLDPQLGELRRSGGKWRGTIHLGDTPVSLVLDGSRSAPDSEALLMAHSIPAGFASWRAEIERGLLEHFTPYAEAVTAGEVEPPAGGLPIISTPADVWSHVSAEYVQITPMGRALMVEIGYRATWDEEHTLGARLRDGKLVELNGSVLAP